VAAYTVPRCCRRSIVDECRSEIGSTRATGGLRRSGALRRDVFGIRSRSPTWCEVSARPRRQQPHPVVSLRRSHDSGSPPSRPLPKRHAGVEATLAEACSLLEQLGLRYAVVGGLAVGAWGVNRSTDDVDIFAELPVKRRPEIMRALVRKGFHVPAMDEELAKFGVFRSRSKQGIFLDLFDSVGPLGEAVVGNRQQVILGKRKLWSRSKEHLLAELEKWSGRFLEFGEVHVATLPPPADRLWSSPFTRPAGARPSVAGRRGCRRSTGSSQRRSACARSRAAAG